MFEFDLFRNELHTCLGYKLQDISFLMFLICSLNVALVLHILLARWNKALIHAAFMVSDYENVHSLLYVLVGNRCVYGFRQSECQENGDYHLENYLLQISYSYQRNLYTNV